MASAMVCGSLNRIKGFSSGKNVGKSQNVRSKKGLKVSCVSSAAVGDPYKILRIDRSASESEVKKAFRKLALRYHPDVCRGKDCSVQFHEINEACDIILKQLRGELMVEETQTMYYDEFDDESMRGMDGEDWDLWEEWMGWEGAGIRDYSSHINPYI